MTIIPADTAHAVSTALRNGTPAAPHLIAAALKNAGHTADPQHIAALAQVYRERAITDPAALIEHGNTALAHRLAAADQYDQATPDQLAQTIRRHQGIGHLNQEN